MNRLPIEDALPELLQTLAQQSNAVLTAPPGAGKTTVVPLALLDAPWLLGKKLLILEPRRLAAKAAAYRMAASLGQSVGQVVGYRMRLDTNVGPRTRIEVVTEGVLTRLLVRNPELDGYGAVLFDEFHERSLNADIGLALARETQRLARPDLRLLVMSATLNCGPVRDVLGGASVITCAGRMFPIETRYLDSPLTAPLETEVVQCIRRSLARDSGSLLVFLPGMAEIRRVERVLLEMDLGANVAVAPLHGDLPQAAQDRAIEPPSPGTRKIVLATSIAETSLTIDGIRVVIDAGLLRAPKFDPRSALTRLDTMRVTRDSADQRRGRAGRLEPGVCYRLWTEREHHSLAAHRSPEILDADLSALLLDVAQWGVLEPMELSWPTPPPVAALSQARDLLTRLGALDANARLTAHGRLMAELPLHPRLAHMLLKSVTLDCLGIACDLAALLSERDLVRASSVRQTDVRVRLDLLHGQSIEAGGGAVDRRAVDRIRRTARQWEAQLRQLTNVSSSGRSRQADPVGSLLAIAYPDRIAQRQKGNEPRYVLASGRGAHFSRPDALAAEPYLVIVELDAGSQWARIDLAAPVSQHEIERLYVGQIVDSEAVTWDDRAAAVRASRRRCLGALVLSEEALAHPDPSRIAGALCDGVRRAGLQSLAWTPELQDLRMRVRFLRRLDGASSEDAASQRCGDSAGNLGERDVSAARGRAGAMGERDVPASRGRVGAMGERDVSASRWRAGAMGERDVPASRGRVGWPDLSDEHLAESLEEWLGPFVLGMTTLERVQRMDLRPPLLALLSPSQQRDLNRLAPTHLAVPSGSSIRLDYGGDVPSLAVRLQEMFGCTETPRIANGTVPVMLHLLSPAKLPVQVTKDLASFWIKGYPEVRKELRGRYPKHHWPDNPLAAVPTAKTKKRH